MKLIHHCYLFIYSLGMDVVLLLFTLHVEWWNFVNCGRHV